MYESLTSITAYKSLQYKMDILEKSQAKNNEDNKLIQCKIDILEKSHAKNNEENTLLQCKIDILEKLQAKNVDNNQPDSRIEYIKKYKKLD